MPLHVSWVTSETHQSEPLAHQGGVLHLCVIPLALHWLRGDLSETSAKAALCTSTADEETSLNKQYQTGRTWKTGLRWLNSQSSTLLPPNARVKATKGHSGLRLGWQLSVVSRQSVRCEQTHRSRAAYWHGVITYLRAFQCRCAIMSRDED